MQILGLGAALLLLLDLTMGEMAPGTKCAQGKTWSSDLGKCMNCGTCREAPKSDFCGSCTEIAPKEYAWLWPVVGSVAGVLILVFAIGAFLVVRRCKKKEKFTTPIEETGRPHSAEEALLN
ncbi:tumor necrosis factor receptor superfamily member 12A-like [Lissotriton helveticus]